MPYSDIYLYSPLSIKSVKEGHNRTLLLQFILSEIFHAMDAEKKDDPLDFVFSSPACFFPYDWSYEVGCLNKIAEHAKLLFPAFPKLKQASNKFNQYLESILTKVAQSKKKKAEFARTELLTQLNTLYVLLEPFFIACNKCENLLLFLLKNADEIAALINPENVTSLLRKMFPEGFDSISHLLKREYKNRGFQSHFPEIDRLLSYYEQ